MNQSNPVLPPIRVFNTLTGTKEDFRPWNAPRVNMYVCGITPYSTSHFGHGLSAVVFDMIRRYLDFRGYEVRYVQNFTDIDDKIINRANELGIDPRKLPERYINEYIDAIRSLNVLPATAYPRATGELDRIVDLIKGLIERGHAYDVNGDVYFRVASDADYGKLSHRDVDDLIAGSRVEVDERKESPADFALWKSAKPGEPTWPSPWGPGRPGWHVECSAMSIRYLGEQLDIHGGGQDLIFPHHENEIAQSECFTGRVPFVKYWMHNGFILFNQTKMSKSIGNVVSLPSAIASYGPEAVRLFILQSHYRSPLNLADESIVAAQRGIERLTSALAGADNIRGPTSAFSESARTQFIEAMDDDFNTPGAIAVLFDCAREVNRQTEAGHMIEAVAARSLLRELADVLGLRLTDAEAGGNLEAAPFVDLLVRIRRELRAAKNFALADELRKELTDLGITIEDRPDSSVWRKA